jgi:FkbM family methyltransferase
MASAQRELEVLGRLKARFGGFVDRFRIRQGVTAFLDTFPIRLRSGQTKIPIRCWSDLLAYAEIFRAGVYDPVFLECLPKTVCDVGCQSGMATLRLSGLGRAPSRALLIDANPCAIRRCQSNLRELGLERYVVIHGAVGARGDDRRDAEAATQFVLRPNELECGLAGSIPIEKQSTVIQVPAINLEQTWLAKMGDVPCDLLKLDVEGAERGVLLEEETFFRRVQRCLIEWHTPFTSAAFLQQRLAGMGFVAFKTLAEDASNGVLCCERASNG